MRQLSARLLETLACPDHRSLGSQRADALESVAQPGSRRGDQDDVALSERDAEISRHRDRMRKRNFGEVAGIKASRPDGRSLRRIARPESDAVPRAERDRKRRAPGSRAENCDVHSKSASDSHGSQRITNPCRSEAKDPRPD